MVGVEALLRWTHRHAGAIQPTTFIPVAEQMGLMDTIGAFVLRRTLQDARSGPTISMSRSIFRRSRCAIGPSSTWSARHWRRVVFLHRGLSLKLPRAC